MLNFVDDNDVTEICFIDDISNYVIVINYRPHALPA